MNFNTLLYRSGHRSVPHISVAFCGHTHPLPQALATRDLFSILILLLFPE